MSWTVAPGCSPLEEYKDSSQGMLEEVGADVAALGTEVAHLMHLKEEASEGINVMQQDIRQVVERMRAEEEHHAKTARQWEQQRREMQRATAGLWSLLKTSKCTTSLLELAAARRRRRDASASPALGLCATAPRDATAHRSAPGGAQVDSPDRAGVRLGSSSGEVLLSVWSRGGVRFCGVRGLAATREARAKSRVLVRVVPF